MTEEEAKTKICPITSSSGGFERCCGSDCVMWEPYEWFTDGKGGYWSQQNSEEALTCVSGGDCGLKAKELDCRGV